MTSAPGSGSGYGSRVERDPAWLIVCAPFFGYWCGLVRFPFIGLELATAGHLVRMWGAPSWVWLETPCGIVWTHGLHEPESFRPVVEDMKKRPGCIDTALVLGGS